MAVITKEAIAAWKRALDQERERIEGNKRIREATQEKNERERQVALEKQERERQAAIEKQERERRAILEQQERERQAALEKQAREQQATLLCDQLAANPTDRRKSTDVAGVRYDDLKIHAKEAMEACALAMKIYPQEQRYRYQYARTLQIEEPKKRAKITQGACTQ